MPNSTPKAGTPAPLTKPDNVIPLKGEVAVIGPLPQIPHSGVFEPEQLDQVIREAWGLPAELGRMTIETAHFLGGLLIQKKGVLGHGNWRAWLDDNHYSHNVVERYMLLNRNYTLEQVRNFKFVKTALDAIYFKKTRPHKTEPKLTTQVNQHSARARAKKQKQEEQAVRNDYMEGLEEENAELKAVLLDDAEDEDVRAEAENQRNNALASKDKRIEKRDKEIAGLEEENRQLKAQLDVFTKQADERGVPLWRIAEDWQFCIDEMKREQKKVAGMQKRLDVFKDKDKKQKAEIKQLLNRINELEATP